MKRKILHIIAGIGGILLISVWGYALREKKEAPLMPEERLKVVTTIYPLYLIATEVGGKIVEVENLIPIDAQPWQHVISNDERDKAARADVFIRTETPIDEWARDIATETPLRAEVVLGKNLRLLPSLPLLDGGVSSETLSSYFWLDPGRTMLAAVQIRDALIARDPSHKQIFWNQTSSFLETLTMLDRDTRERMRGVGQKNIAVHRNYLTYFVESFGLSWVGAAIMRPGDMPSNAHLSKLAGLMHTRGVTTMFIDGNRSDWLDTFAKQQGISLPLFDPLERYIADIDDAQPPSFDRRMRANMMSLSGEFGYMPELE